MRWPFRRKPPVAPEGVYVYLRDDELVLCLIEYEGRRDGLEVWQAVPVTDIRVDEIEGLHVDMLPAKTAIHVLCPMKEDE